MTIKTKLLSLITVYILLFCGIIGLYFLIMAPIEEIEEEKEYLLELKNSIQDERIMLGKLTGQSPFVRQATGTSTSRWTSPMSAFAEVERMPLLRQDQPRHRRGPGYHHPSERR